MRGDLHELNAAEWRGMALVSALVALLACVVSLTSLVWRVPSPNLVLAPLGITTFLCVAGAVLMRMARWSTTGHRLSFRRAPRAALLAVAIPVVVLLLSLRAGGGPPVGHPEQRGDTYVATEHGAVVRRLTQDEYREMQMRELRATLRILGILAAGSSFLWWRGARFEDAAAASR